MSWKVSKVFFSTGVGALFLTGASYLFISSAHAFSLGLKTKELVIPVSIEIPMCNTTYLSRYCTAIIALHRGSQLEDDSVVMIMKPYNLILGVVWLTIYCVVVDCCATKKQIDF